MSWINLAVIAVVALAAGVLIEVFRVKKERLATSPAAIALLVGSLGCLLAGFHSLLTVNFHRPAVEVWTLVGALAAALGAVVYFFGRFLVWVYVPCAVAAVGLFCFNNWRGSLFPRWVKSAGDSVKPVGAAPRPERDGGNGGDGGSLAGGGGPREPAAISSQARFAEAAGIPEPPPRPGDPRRKTFDHFHDLWAAEPLPAGKEYWIDLFRAVLARSRLRWETPQGPPGGADERIPIALEAGSVPAVVARAGLFSEEAAYDPDKKILILKGADAPGLAVYLQDRQIRAGEGKWVGVLLGLLITATAGDQGTGFQTYSTARLSAGGKTLSAAWMAEVAPEDRPLLLSEGGARALLRKDPRWTRGLKVAPGPGTARSAVLIDGESPPILLRAEWDDRSATVYWIPPNRGTDVEPVPLREESSPAAVGSR